MNVFFRFLACIIFLGNTGLSQVESIDRMVYENGKVTIDFTHRSCEGQNYELKIEECWAGQPLWCSAELAPVGTSLSCEEQVIQTTDSFVIPKSFRDTAFILRMGKKDSLAEVVITEKVLRPTIIQSINFVPETDTDGEISGYHFQADVLMGMNPCQSEGTEVFIESAGFEDKVIIKGFRAFDQIKDQYQCLTEDYSPVTRTLTGFFAIDPEKTQHIEIKNLMKMNLDQVVPASDELARLDLEPGS